MFFFWCELEKGYKLPTKYFTSSRERVMHCEHWFNVGFFVVFIFIFNMFLVVNILNRYFKISKLFLLTMNSINFIWHTTQWRLASDFALPTEKWRWGSPLLIRSKPSFCPSSVSQRSFGCCQWDHPLLWAHLTQLTILRIFWWLRFFTVPLPICSYIEVKKLDS